MCPHRAHGSGVDVQHHHGHGKNHGWHPPYISKIDCVFKALLGSEENRNLLVNFLNAVLVDDLTSPITEAEILNPYNDKEFLGDCERGGCKSQG